MTTIYIKDCENIPTYATQGSAAIDLVLPKDLSLAMGEFQLVDFNIQLVMPDNVAALLLPRSGLGGRYGIVLRNNVGLIDSDYHDSIQAMIINQGNEPQTYLKGTRIAQLLFIPYIKANLVTVDSQQFEDLTQSSERMGGFGSTGLSLTDQLPDNAVMV